MSAAPGLICGAEQSHLRNEETGAETTIATEVVIGADGAASAIRTEMLKLPRFNFSQQYLDYGYKELTIPAGPERQSRHGTARAAYLAARNLHADRAAQHRRHLRMHSVPAV